MKRSIKEANLSITRNQNANRIRRYFRNTFILVSIFLFAHTEAQVKKIKYAGNVSHINIEKADSTAIAKPDSLFGKAITADEINICTEIETLKDRDFSTIIYHPLECIMRCLDGSSPIVIDDWQKTGLPLSILFRN